MSIMQRPILNQIDITHVKAQVELGQRGRSAQAAGKGG